jgi:predicted metal-dependent phosphotriesterase family hydrolase
MEKWVTDSVYVDRETGEIIDKARVKNGEYIIYNKSIKVIKKDGYKSKTITTECKENQTRIFEKEEAVN